MKRRKIGFARVAVSPLAQTAADLICETGNGGVEGASLYVFAEVGSRGFPRCSWERRSRSCAPGTMHQACGLTARSAVPGAHPGNQQRQTAAVQLRDAFAEGGLVTGGEIRFPLPTENESAVYLRLRTE